MTPLSETPFERLPALDPAAAKRQSDWVEALNNRLFGEFSLRAELVPDAGAGPWIAFESDAGQRLFLKPLLAGGEVPALSDAAGRPDAALTAAAMGEIEPLIGAIERALGASLRPTQVADRAHGGLILSLDAAEGDAVLHRALVVLPDDLTCAGAPLPVDPEVMFRTIPTVIAQIAGPAVAQAALAAIAAGDLLLLGNGAPVATLSPPGSKATMIARVDLQGRVLVIGQALDEIRPAAAAAEGVPGDGLAIPTVVEIDATGLTADRLAALAPGSVVPILAAAGEMLPVRLRAAGRAIAAGQLVTVGEGYGVLVTERLSGADREA